MPAWCVLLETRVLRIPEAEGLQGKHSRRLFNVSHRMHTRISYDIPASLQCDHQQLPWHAIGAVNELQQYTDCAFDKLPNHEYMQLINPQPVPA